MSGEAIKLDSEQKLLCGTFRPSILKLNRDLKYTIHEKQILTLFLHTGKIFLSHLMASPTPDRANPISYSDFTLL